MAQKSQVLEVLEAIVNTIMGVKTDDNAARLQASSPDAAVDWRAVGLYVGGTLLQILVMILGLWGLQKVTLAIPAQWAMYPALGFFTLVSVRSRLFSPLDNTRSRATYNTFVRPNWAPPPLAFPFVWMTISVLRVISSYWIWQAVGQNYLALPLILFVIHLALGDTWNTIFTVEGRLGAAVPVVLAGPLASSLMVTAAYWQAIPLAGYLLVPMCIWLMVASALVFEIWRLNGQEPWYPMKLQGGGVR